MKLVKRLLLVGIIVLGIYYIIQNPELRQHDQTELNQKEMLLEKKQNIQSPNKHFLDTDLLDWIGKSSDELINDLGEPIRKDLSPYGYTSYVYIEEFTKYLVFGVEDDQIVTVYGTGSKLNLDKINIGETYEDLNDQLSFENEIEFRKGTSSFTVMLNTDDLQSRPVVKINNNLYIQFYFDIVTNTLSAIRILDNETLLLQQSYEFVYRGAMPSKNELSNDDWEKIERGQEQQLFELTNIIRNIYDHQNLSWETDASKVAFAHSKDMENNNYFSHASLDGSGLSDRLADRNISFQLAGENIAANYPDALAAIIGWLNSDGHRESLLNEEYTHLGVGIYRLYYTQNFIKK